MEMSPRGSSQVDAVCPSVQFAACNVFMRCETQFRLLCACRSDKFFPFVPHSLRVNSCTVSRCSSYIQTCL